MNAVDRLLDKLMPLLGTARHDLLIGHPDLALNAVENALNYLRDVVDAREKLARAMEGR